MEFTIKLKKRFGNDISSLDAWELSHSCVVINRVLGEGAFGTVYGGEASIEEDDKWVPVAVKALKAGSSTEDKIDFFSEAETMKRFDHKNIVKLLGVCMKQSPLYTIMEFMLYGDLKTYLLARRHMVNDSVTVEDSDEISSRRLTSMALDIARALSYLAQERYVHRDVASRNCLVGQKIVKLGDFGMTRPMFENDHYKFNRKDCLFGGGGCGSGAGGRRAGMLPVRWMSPESLQDGVFSPASDIWSYGVLLYEIVTFGSFPFGGMSNNEVLHHVKAGHTLEIPKKVKPHLEGLISSCWHHDPKRRPPAAEIVVFLANHPKLITPCLDAPLSAVQIEHSDQITVAQQPPVRNNRSSVGGAIRNRSVTSLLSNGSAAVTSSMQQPHQQPRRSMSWFETMMMKPLPAPDPPDTDDEYVESQYVIAEPAPTPPTRVWPNPADGLQSNGVALGGGGGAAECKYVAMMHVTPMTANQRQQNQVASSYIPKARLLHNEEDEDDDAL
ncbi:hypothetical protein LSTR_LSTR015021 [Laodelphax striatellus]|uniref:Protein kinase domain-containing protein n=1 Tax=Laodelphax striatellus TaxID=195883 RepID=A0A482WQE4_LAOST|nr:hypothetical protein LSTR_LSTR015021 [Laodelphax striatellus]